MLTTNNSPEPIRETLKETLLTQTVKITNGEGISIVKTIDKQAYKYQQGNKVIIGFPVNLKRTIKPFKEV